MPDMMDDPVVKLLAERKRALDALSGEYAIKYLDDGRCYLHTKDATVDAPAIDTSKMAVPCTISTQDEDRSKDIVVTAGIDLANHQTNPVVLLNHGWNTAGKFPTIAKAVDPDGNYTVTLGTGKARAVSWFTNKVKDSEQTFHLIAEGLLKGVSIGFTVKAAEYRRDHPDDYEGWPGLLIAKSDMFEYSHCPIGCNPHALADKVGKGYLMGSPISEQMMKSFAPYLPALKEMVVGGFDPKQPPALEKQTMSVETQNPAVTPPVVPPVETKGGAGAAPPAPAPVAPPAVPPVAPPVATKEAPVVLPDVVDDYTKNLLPGAVRLLGLHDRLLDDAEWIADSFKAQENEAVKGVLAEISEAIEVSLEKINSTWREQYPQDDAPDGLKDLDVEEDSETKSYLPGAVELIAKRVERVKANRQKSSDAQRLGSAAILTAKQAAACLAELGSHTGTLTATQQTAAQSLAKTLGEIQAAPLADPEELKNAREECARYKLALEKANQTLEALQTEIKKRQNRR